MEELAHRAQRAALVQAALQQQHLNVQALPIQEWDNRPAPLFPQAGGEQQQALCRSHAQSVSHLPVVVQQLVLPALEDNMLHQVVAHRFNQVLALYVVV